VPIRKKVGKSEVGTCTKLDKRFAGFDKGEKEVEHVIPS